MGSIQRSESCDYDVVIIGAGIAGLNTAYRIQSELPDLTYTILENRGAIGGTWDLFRYPGVRSDSDLYTFGFAWRSWVSPRAIATGESIRTYLRESAEEFGIDKKIQFYHNVVAADWESEYEQWTLSVAANGTESTMRARWVVWATGYYDYSEPLNPNIPGMDNFQGQKIHPQFWPKDLDYTDKKIVVIGSGATAITLLPSLAEKAAKVTMLQRSPSWILGVPAVDSLGISMRKYLPRWIASPLLRLKFVVSHLLFFHFCRLFPNAARTMITKETKKELPYNLSFDPNFNPRYDPWEQRFCVCPDSDFFKSLHSGKADIVTDTIRTVTSSGINLTSGQTLDADIIVTATGLKLKVGGGAKISVDGIPCDSQKYMWRGAMLQDMPNSFTMLGYTNISWTIGADATARLMVRMIKHVRANNYTTAVPKMRAGYEKKMNTTLAFDLTSTYVQKAKRDLPLAGDRGPWKLRQNYWVDYWVAKWGSLTSDIVFGGEHNKNQ